jgi:signal transduction histidine kinase
MSAPSFGPMLEELRSSFRNRPFDWDIFVFLAYFLTAKLAQYILLDLHTSPALIWAPTGIALAAVLLKGYKMWFPVACAYLVAVITLPSPPPPPEIFISLIGFTLQPILGAWGLEHFDSNGTIHRTHDVVVLILGSFVIAAVGPLSSIVGQLLFSGISSGTWLIFSRGWVGGVLGILVVTPFITGWYYSPRWPMTRRQLPEAVAALGLLMVSVYVLFWTAMSSSLAFLLIFTLCISLFWLALRFGSRVIVSAVLFLTVFGIMGSIISHPTPIHLNDQLLADELFIILIAPVFFVFFTVTEDRRVIQRTLAGKIRELEHMTKQLHSNDQSKNEFIAILAHELRNPLAAIVSTLELLHLDEQQVEQAKMLEAAGVQARVMRRLLEDLLDVARVEQKKFKLAKEPANLSDIITQSVALTQDIVRRRRHVVTISLPRKPVWLTADPIRLEQIVVNLLENAAKYTNPGGTIDLSLTRERGAAVIEVRDSGVGIPEAELGNIFLPFRQTRPAARMGSGLGIGLSVTKRLVEMHEGQIEVRSDGPGKGSTFIVRLPMQRGVEPPSPIKRFTLPRRQKIAALEILVVDDNELAARALGKLLAHKGHSVTLAHTGWEALRIAARVRPQVMVLDIGLPDIDGYEVARRMRRTSSALTLVALTGFGQDQDKRLAQEAGFDYHLVKPVSVTDVERVLRTL